MSGAHRRVGGGAALQTLAVLVVATAVLCLPVAGAWARTQRVSASARLHTTKVYRDGSFVQTGTVRIAPLGRGRMAMHVRISHGRAIARFTVRLRHGLVRGAGSGRLVFRRSTAIVRGAATVTGGTKAYRRARGRRLRLTASGPADLSWSRLRLTGTVSY